MGKRARSISNAVPVATSRLARVALFVNSVEMGGVEEHVRQLAQGLSRRGAVVTLICPESPEIDSLASAAADAGVRVSRLTLSLREQRWRLVQRLWTLQRALHRHGVEILHIHLIGYDGGRWALLAAKLARVPVVICTAHLAPREPQHWRKRLERRLMNVLCDQFIAVSRASRGRQVQYLGQSPTKTVAIPNAVELDRYTREPAPHRDAVRGRLGIPPDAVLIGCVARLSPQKGLSVLVDALPEVVRKHPELHVLLLGDGPLRNDLESQASRLRVRERVHFAGYQHDIPSHLSAMDLFVLPSFFEGLPLAVLEAMAAGLPVVATAVDGTPEAVVDSVTGRLVPPGDAGALAAAICEVLCDRETAVKMGRAGRERAEQFSVDVLVERVASVYANALARRGRIP